jgi:hypothetical protein
MTKVTRTSMLLALVIGTMLGGAYLITVRNNAAMNGVRQETPSGFLH